MKNNVSGKKMIAGSIYGLGIICVIYFLIRGFLGGNHVSNPQAMLPVTDFESSMFVLGIGFIPMAVSCLFLIYAFQVKGYIRRILVCLPGLVTLVPFALVALVLLNMFLKGSYEAIAGTQKKPVILENVVVKEYTVLPGKNDVYSCKITVKDVEETLGTDYTDEMYDYLQGMRRMVYQDEVNGITMCFVYLETSEGNIINWIEMIQ